MVASEDGNAVLKAHLQGHQQGHCLHGVVSAIDVVTHEEVVGVWELSSNHEELTQVVELAVDVAANGHGGDHALHVLLVHKDFFCLES